MASLFLDAIRASESVMMVDIDGGLDGSTRDRRVWGLGVYKGKL